MKLVKTACQCGMLAHQSRLSAWNLSRQEFCDLLNVRHRWSAGTGAMCILRISNRTRKPSFWLLLCFLQKDCFALSAFLSHSFCLSFSPSPPTHCSRMSARDLIEQIDRKWSRGVWGNQSNIVKQFFGHEGISLACIELIRSHSSQRWLDSEG